MAHDDISISDPNAKVLDQLKREILSNYVVIHDQRGRS